MLKKSQLKQRQTFFVERKAKVWLKLQNPYQEQIQRINMNVWTAASGFSCNQKKNLIIAKGKKNMCACDDNDRYADHQWELNLTHHV